MARIPVGSFGQVAPQAAPGADESAVGEALQTFGRVAVGVASIVQDNRQRTARAESANAYLDHQIGSQIAAEEIRDGLASGTILPDDAQAEYQKRVAKLPLPEIAYLPGIDRQNLERGFKRNTFAGAKLVDAQAEVTRKALQRGQVAAAFDKLGKLAGMPGADIEGINGQAGAFREAAIAAGIPEAEFDRSLQNFKDQNWLNHATQAAMERQQDMAGLKELRFDLTDEKGYYAGKLDTNARNAVLRSVIGDMDRLQYRIDREVDKREARAAIAMGNIHRQVASGVPATADMWSEWSQVVNGTSFAAEFKDMVKAEEEVQDVLRMPVEAQVKYAADKEAKLLTEGGSVQDAANVNRLQAAVKENVNQMVNVPLAYIANRTGEEVRPLDLSSLGNPESTEIAKQLQERAISIRALQKNNPQVKMHPLLPEEAAVLAASLNGSGARQGTMLLAGLRNQTGDDETYLGIMQQIAPDAPVKSLAGMLASKQRNVTLERNWTSNDVVASSPDVATVILRGAEALQPTKDAKGQDGKPRSDLYLPPEAAKDLQDEFTSAVGTAFAGREDAAQNAFQATKSYYVGKAIQDGRLASDKMDVETRYISEAITATLGEVVDYNNNGEVLAPWGMDPTEFEDRVERAFAVEAKKRGLPPATAGQLDMLGLQNAGDGTYFVTNGRTFILDENGDPLLLDVLNPSANAPEKPAQREYSVRGLNP